MWWVLCNDNLSQYFSCFRRFVSLRQCSGRRQCCDEAISVALSLADIMSFNDTKAAIVTLNIHRLQKVAFGRRCNARRDERGGRGIQSSNGAQAKLRASGFWKNHWVPLLLSDSVTTCVSGIRNSTRFTFTSIDWSGDKNARDLSDPYQNWLVCPMHIELFYLFFLTFTDSNRDRENGLSLVFV